MITHVKLHIHLIGIISSEVLHVPFRNFLIGSLFYFTTLSRKVNIVAYRTFAKQ
jgi:hypothetical protein